MASIHRAVNNGNLNRVRALLNSGTSINRRTIYGWTPLIHAAYYGHLAIVRELLNRGANINARTNTGISALMYAALGGRTAVVGELLKRGANKNGVMNRINISANMKNFITRKHNAVKTISRYQKAATMRRRAAAAKTLNNVRTPKGRPLPPNAIRSIMSMLKPRSPR